MTKTYQKPALTFQQQLEQLKGRGLTISDEASALAQLRTVSYYRLSIYWESLRKKENDGKFVDEFKEGANFDEVVALYEFDRHLRLAVMDAIERIEVHLRTRFTHQIGVRYGADGYTEAKNFDANFRPKHPDWLQKVRGDVERADEKFLRHYERNYDSDSDLPIWMLTEVMPLGRLTVGYGGLEYKDQREISEVFNMSPKALLKWLRTLIQVRNLCAHHSRLWNREFRSAAPQLNDPGWSALGPLKENRIFCILLLLRVSLKALDNGDNGEAWKEHCSVLLEPVAQHKHWRQAMGLPVDWQNHPMWK